MLTFSVIPILTSIAVNNKRDITIVYNRIIALVLIFSLYILYINKYNLLKGIILFNGLFYLENYNFFFISFILILSSFIILLTSFIPRNIKQDSNNNNYKGSFALHGKLIC